MQFNLAQLRLAFMLLVAAAAVSASLIMLLRPLMTRYALVRPNARSLHREPTPQGGGIAVVVAALGVAAAAAAAVGLPEPEWHRLAMLSLAAAGLAIIGGLDDVRPMPPGLRLAVQLALATFAIWQLPVGLRVVPAAPLLLERTLLVVALAWFVNLTNFMDGMDWMAVAEIVPVAAALAAFAAMGVLPPFLGLVALGLCGGMIGFAPFNAPAARLFLGDVGSLPVGFLIGYCLIELAARGEFAAAVLLPLYYLADTGLTLIRRIARRERVWQAHREHFYQLAAARGVTAGAVIARVLAVNLILVGLALISHAVGETAASALAGMVGALAVAVLLRSLAQGSRAAETAS